MHLPLQAHLVLVWWRKGVNGKLEDKKGRRENREEEADLCVSPRALEFGGVCGLKSPLCGNKQINDFIYVSPS